MSDKIINREGDKYFHLARKSVLPDSQIKNHRYSSYDNEES